MKILIADDHDVVRKGLIALLRLKYPGADIVEAVDGSDAVHKSKAGNWDVIILDITMPGLNGLEALKQIRSLGIKTPVLMLSMLREDQYAVRALKAGASGFINKECAYNELMTAIEKACKGKKYVSEALSQKLASTFSPVKNEFPHESLSDREMQVLELIAGGKTLSEIASSIGLSANTVSTYRARLLEKLSLTTNAELIRYALDNDLV